VAYKNRERGRTGFPVQTCYVGGEKTVGDPPTVPMPENGHRAHDRQGRVPDNGPIHENRSKERARQGETKGGWKAHPGGETRRIVARAAFASVYLLEKWGLGSKARVKMKPDHFRRDCGYKS